MAQNNDNKSKGLGDTLSKIIKNITLGKVEECEPCKKRKEALNKKFPYKSKKRDD
tara:strand:+ start:124 stop:288 length:165 start_codon:yes stop_codon:yes gene_type:complete